MGAKLALDLFFNRADSATRPGSSNTNELKHNQKEIECRRDAISRASVNEPYNNYVPSSDIQFPVIVHSIEDFRRVVAKAINNEKENTPGQYDIQFIDSSCEKLFPARLARVPKNLTAVIIPADLIESFKEIFLQQFPVARFFGGPLGARIRHTAKPAHTFR